MPRVSHAVASLLLVFLAVASFLAACGDNNDPAAEVVATTVQIGALTREVAGDSITVRTLVGPGVDPHDYEATADDIRRVGDAKVVLRHGIGLDVFLDKAIEGSGAGNVVTVTEGIPLRYGAERSRDPDSHVWHNPMHAKVMVDNIVQALSAAFPDKADTFRANGDAYKMMLDQADDKIRQLIDGIPPANRKMVTNHDAFGYFIDRYGLEFVGAVIPSVSTQGEASARQLAELEDTIRREGVKAIFAESSVDPKVATEIAKDTGVKIVDDLYGDSLGEPGSEAATVHGMLLANAAKIADALK